MEPARRKRTKVTNYGSKDFSEEVTGKLYEIPAGESIILPRREAIALRGNYPGDKVEKMLKLEHLDPPEVKSNMLCNFCGQTFHNVDEFHSHLAMHNKFNPNVNPNSTEFVDNAVTPNEQGEGYVDAENMPELKDGGKIPRAPRARNRAPKVGA